MKRHLIADRRLELIAGVAVFALGTMLLWDATEGRGQRAPWLLRAVAPI